MLGINTVRKLQQTVSGRPQSLPAPDTSSSFESRQEKYALPLDPCANPADVDGFYVGRDGRAYDPSHFTPAEVPPFLPQRGVHDPRRVFFVNGICEIPTDTVWNPRESWEADGAAQDLADRSGHPVVFVYNATRGLLPDCLESILDRNGKGHNPSVQTLKSALRQERAAHDEPILAGHSQGAAIIASALSSIQREQCIADMDVWLFGSAAKRLPSGPNYEVSNNLGDPLCVLLGGMGSWHSKAKNHFFFDSSSGRKELVRGGPHSTNAYFRSSNFAKMDKHKSFC